MSPVLRNIVLNGASRHRLSKGFLLLQNNGQPVSVDIRQKFLDASNGYFKSQAEFVGFAAEGRTTASSVIGLATPFMPVYTSKDRDTFINSLQRAVSTLLKVATYFKLIMVPAGVNPFFTDASQGQVPALCADIHQIEVYDDGEVERIYNLFRQFLPELLAVSSHSSVYGGVLQKDFSLRMRVNPSSFLPRYLSQFSVEHLDRIKSMLRRSYGMADLSQMDVNPLAGDGSKLSKNDSRMLTDQPAAVELRFVDSQVSYPFIRAQMILFQAIAMYGRSLARRGKRLPFLRDEIIDENKALAVQNGPGAILVPDPKFSKGKDGTETAAPRREGYSYHDKGKPERATTALLMTIDGVLLPSLREMKCEFREIAPIILGAELRKRGRQCFASYAEYQKYLHYTYTKKFAQSFHEQSLQLLENSIGDPATEYNRRTYKDITDEIEQAWSEKLKPIMRERFQGKVMRYDKKTESGHVQLSGQPDVYFRAEDIVDGSRLHLNDVISYSLIKTSRGLRAIQIELVKASPKPATSQSQIKSRNPKQTGTVKWYKAEKHFGYIVTSEGKDVFVHESALKGVKELKSKQKVEFELTDDPKGLKALNVRVVEEKQS
jgi:CspA family cold shock protein